MTSRPALALLFALCVAPGCSKPKDGPAPPDKKSATPAPSASSAAPGHEHIATRVQLTSKVIADASIKTLPVTREALLATVDLPGEIAADPDKSARVATPVAGRLEQVNFKEGGAVKRGDVLALVRVPELGKARAAYAANAAQAVSARTNADRLQSLAEKGLAAKQDALSAKAEAEALEAQRRAAGEQLHALGMGVDGAGSQLALRAPMTGVVVRRNGIVGQPVTTDETIALIADLSDVWFLGRVFERSLDELRTGARAQVTLNAYKAERFAGTVEYIGKEIDPSSRTLLARIRLTNRGDLLRVGLFGTAQVDAAGGDAGAATLVAPLDALADIQDKPVVFVRAGDGAFEVRKVRVGRRALGKVEILDGVREGEQVVTDGLFTVKSAALKATFAEEE